MKYFSSFKGNDSTEFFVEKVERELPLIFCILCYWFFAEREGFNGLRYGNSIFIDGGEIFTYNTSQ